MHSCIYEGTVAHRRRDPVTHQFQNRLFMVYLDLDELPQLVGSGGVISSTKLATRSFLRGDHLFDNSQSLTAEVREMIHQQTGRHSQGPIRLLTQLRYFGYYFSPLNLFFVFDNQGEQIEYVVAEVNNTPWQERHCYVLWEGNRRTGVDGLRFSHPKEFHVSPFMHMAMQYEWHLAVSDQSLSISLCSTDDERLLFSSGMTLERRELSRPMLRRMTVRYPLMTARISAAIYYQALKLWWKKCPFYTHPKKQPVALSAKPSQEPTPIKAAPARR